MPKTDNQPKQHIDTSVLIEPENTEDGRFCKRYLQKVNYNYTGVLSFPVLSELFLIVQGLNDFNDRYDFLEPLLAMIKIRNMQLYAQVDIGTILNSIRIADNRISPIDREILACASEDAAQALVTLDKDMLHNKNLEKTLRIRILHPKDLL